MTGDEGLSFPDIQYFLSWLDPADPKIDIEIHSCGGDTVEGYAIYDALRASGKEISCTVVGRCASMATIICFLLHLNAEKLILMQSFSSTNHIWQDMMIYWTLKL